ncbi:hypothetical protein HanHA300_Chr07g0244831 [Helianthus annuus]|nr:hypothetical protein HanHA300_Chr07g0244831 [Helianthus annuus]KAJ0563347.1 hypothetical protein HanHA89_Chr07g0262031 [Helianthus annuus]
MFRREELCLQLLDTRASSPSREVRRLRSPDSLFGRRLRITGIEKQLQIINKFPDEGHKTSTAEELSDENSSVTLSFRSIDPLQTRAKDAALTASFSKNTASVATHGCRLTDSCK